jgi:hypothetical protein
MLLCFGLIAYQHFRLGALEQRLESQAESIARAQVAQMKSLSSGIYRLEMLTDTFGDGETAYTIYNFVINIKVGPFRRNIQFGYGDGEDAPFILYFDHDSDGQTDTKTLVKYARTIPIAGTVSVFLFDPEYSQLAYDTFQSNFDQAEKLSLEGLSQYVDAKIVTLWGWINGKSGDIAEWLEESLELE